MARLLAWSARLVPVSGLPLLLIGAAPDAFASRAEHAVYVSPAGDDSWSGRLAAPNRARTDGPFATVARAQIAARQLPRDQPIRVLIRKGTYFLSEPLVFRPEDSGTTECPVIYSAYPGERPCLSAGRRISGWKQLPDGSWQTNISDVAAGKWYFEQLFVNGERRFRPRLPRGDQYYHITAEAPRKTLPNGKEADGFGFTPGDLKQSWHNLSDVQVLPFQIWTMARMPIASVDDAGNTVTLAGCTASTQYYHKLSPGRRYLVENVREALSEPGEWYLDRKTGDLTYLPKEGESLPRAEVIAPRLEQLIRFEGSLSKDAFVHHIELRGLAFAHTNWVTPAAGYGSPQAEVPLDAAVSATGAHSCTIARCNIAHTGTWAVAWNDGCQGNILRESDLTDLGAGGVKVGPFGYTTDTLKMSSGNVVERCMIAHGGRIHPAATGVLIGHSSHNRIERNTITDFYYTGISVGWSWGYGPSNGHHNRIADNRISRIGQGVLSDMGGIYTLGVCPGTVLEHNWIQDVDAFDYGGWGIYFDEGTSYIEAKNNIVLNTKCAGIHQHYGRENLVQNNIFAFGRQESIARSRMEPHKSFDLVRNIVTTERPELLWGKWSDKNYRMDRNLYWNVKGSSVTLTGKSLAEWRTAGQDVHSVVANPRFANAARGDFRLRSNAAVRRIGFTPIRLTGFGCGRAVPPLQASRAAFTKGN